MAAVATTKSSGQQQQQHQPGDRSNCENSHQTTNQTSGLSNKLDLDKRADLSNNTNDLVVVYDVEHLATFSTSTATTTTAAAPNSNNDGQQQVVTKTRQKSLSSKSQPTNSKTLNSVTLEPRVAIEKLFELEKTSGIWTQRMQIELHDDQMLIIDCETNSIVERFQRNCVTKPETFNQHNDIYDNIIVFVIDQNQNKNQNEDQSEHHPTGSELGSSSSQLEEQIPGELHIFQCISHRAQQLVTDILDWKQRANSSRSTGKEVASKYQQQLVDKSARHPESAMAHEQNGQVDKQDTKTAAAPSDLIDKSHHNSQRDFDINNKSTASDSLSQQKQRPTSSDKKPDHTSANRLSSSTSGPQAGSGVVGGGVGQLNSKPVVTVASSASSSESAPIVNVNVKETVQVFNQIAALREKGKPSSPTNHTTNGTSATTSAAAAVTTTTTTPSSSSSTKPLSEGSTASNSQRDSTGNSNGNSNDLRNFFNGHSYKQRSIRATLAPDVKVKSTNGQPDSVTSIGGSGNSSSINIRNNDPAVGSSSVSSSSMTSSSDLAKSSSSDQPLHHHQSRHPASSGNNNNNNHHHHHNQQQRDNGKGHHASSKSPTAGHHQHQQHYQSGHHQHNNSNNIGNSSNNNNGKQSSTKLSSSRQANGSSSSFHHHHNHQHQPTSSSSSSHSHRTHENSPSSQLNQQQQQQQQFEQVTTNESYVSVLNHCFDDIEKFIIRLQHAVAAMRELHIQKKLCKRSSQLALNGQLGTKISANGGGGLATTAPMSSTELAMLSAKARGPSEDDYFEILSKFKLAFNLLAKLKGCIHEPNAPELVHFLFTPLAIIIESARNVTPPIDPTLVGIPYLNKDALDLLSNCCTSKESDMWLSLGPNWTQTIDVNLLKASRLPSSFQPIFSDGWAPIITELELIGLVMPPQANTTTTLGASKVPITEPLNEHYRSRRSYMVNEDPPVQRLPDGANYASSRITNGVGNGVGLAKGHRKRGSPTPMSSNKLSGRQSSAAAYGYDYGEDPGIGDPNGPYRVPGGYLGGSRHPARSKSSSRPRMVPLEYPLSHEQPFVDVHGHSHLHNHQPSLQPLDLVDPAGSSSYLANYPVTNGNSIPIPSDDYTELHTNSHHSEQLPLSGPSSHYRQSRPHNRYAVPAPLSPTALDHSSRRRSSKARAYPHDGGVGGDHLLPLTYDQPTSFDDSDREAMLLDLGPAQTDWLLELQSRGALIVRVLFTREANNDKELSVRRGEILEILDDSRKWWKARNIDLQVAYVPHTIVAVIEHYQTLDELLTNGPPGDLDDPSAAASAASAFVQAKRLSRHDIQADYNQNFGRSSRDRRNSAAASGGAFRYF